MIRRIIFFTLLLVFSGCGLKSKPPYVEAYEKAETLYKAKSYRESLALYNQVIARYISSSPEIFQSYLKIAYIHALLKQFENAYQTLKDLAYMTRKMEDTKQKKKILNEIQEMKKQVKKLASKYRQRINSAKVAQIYNLGLQFYKRGDIGRAYRYFKSIEGEEYKDTEKYVEELESLISRKVEKLFQEGFRFYVAERYKEAVEKFDLILELDPDHKDANYYKSKAKKKLEVLESM